MKCPRCQSIEVTEYCVLCDWPHPESLLCDRLDALNRRLAALESPKRLDESAAEVERLREEVSLLKQLNDRQANCLADNGLLLSKTNKELAALRTELRRLASDSGSAGEVDEAPNNVP